MSTFNFSDQLMQARRRARLSGRPLSQQETSAISEGVAAGASDRLSRAKQLSLQERQIGNQEEQFGKTFEEQRAQFGQSLALEREKMDTLNDQFEKTFGLSMMEAENRRDEFEKTFGLSVWQAGESVRQFNQNYALGQQQIANQQTQFNVTRGDQNYWNQQQVNTANRSSRNNTTSTIIQGVFGAVMLAAMFL